MRRRKPFLTGIKSKVIAAFMLGCVAIASALAITYYSFNGLLNTVDKLTVPNQKLVALNSLYRKVTQLDQLQRARAIRNPKNSYTALLRESESLLATLDTLKAMQWEDEQQIGRLGAMEKILHQRDKLLLSYLRMKSEFVVNPELSQRLDSLASIITWTQAHLDSSVTTTEHRTVTTTYAPKNMEEKKSVWSWLSGKKNKTDSQETKIEVQEELRVKVDTLATAQKDSAIAEVGRLMKDIEQNQRLQSEQMLHRELALINNNRNLINQLLKNLNEVEKEEKAIEKANHEQAALLVDQSIKRIGLIMIIFFLGAAVLIFLIITDITRSNVLRKQLIQARDEAEQSSQIKQRFLANMSHEIRTPLQSILGFAEQLNQQSGFHQEAIKAIHSSSEHLLHIVNEILDYSKIESGKLVIERETFNLSQLLKEVEAGIRVQAARKNLAFYLGVDIKDNIHLIGDPFRLRQILYNLLGNAVKFTPNGEVRLDVKTEDLGYTVICRFKVIDTGIGMTKEEIDHVFQQFEQAKSTIDRQYGGTGLGLTIVKKLVEVQQGNLDVESEPGKGSVFTVALHFDKAPEVKRHETNNAQQSSKPFSGKVMVVDDDPMILRLCGIILSRNKVPHILFSASDKVLSTPWDEEITLVLLDIRMPHITGIDLCQEIRKKAGEKVKIVALTAHVLPQERASLIQRGFDHVLSKPFREAELLEQLGLTPSPENGAHTQHDTSLTRLREMTAGDESLFQLVLIQFVTDTRHDISLLQGNVIHLKKTDIRESVHKLAGRTGQVGLDSIAGDLRMLETDLAEDNDVPDLEVRINGLINLLNEILAVIEKEYMTEKAST